MKTRILLFILFVICISAHAQVDSGVPSKRKVIYYNNFLAGGLLGASGTGSGLTLSTTHGIRINWLTLGVGVGYDSYFDWKTVPVFGTIEADFAKVKRNAFFLQFNAGYADARRINREEWITDYKEYGGEMVSLMVGYKIRAEKFSMYVLAGHKFQEANFSYNPQPWSSFSSPPNYSVEENMNRFVVQLGFGLH
ncbi:MAG TPA: hypothetical protein VFG46_01260 [Chryseolinea sp.]|nr:hypothetical protein [Chryseolinea sp.]